jgi:putative flippase GtrA
MRILEAPTTLLSPLLRQFIKYGLVGVTNTLASLGVYALCVHFGLWYLAASAVAFAVGATNSYLLNRNWTFQAQGRHSTTVARYVVVQVAGLLGILGVVFVMVDGLGTDKVIGQAIATVIVVLAMFVANRYWTFAGAMGTEVAGTGPAPGRQPEGSEWGPAAETPASVSVAADQRGDLAQRVAAVSRPRP